MSMMKNEVLSLQQFQNHPQIILFYGICIIFGDYYLCTEPMDLCLQRFCEFKKIYIAEDFKGGFIWMPENILAYIFINIFKALKYLNERGYAHGNLNKESILLRRDGTIKLSSFECCWNVKNLKNKEDTICQEIIDLCRLEYYNPPERIFEQNSLDARNDLWAFGATMFETVAHFPLAILKDEYLKDNFVSFHVDSGQGGMVLGYEESVLQNFLIEISPFDIFR